jgi:hypothetical protein
MPGTSGAKGRMTTSLPELKASYSVFLGDSLLYLSIFVATIQDFFVHCSTTLYWSFVVLIRVVATKFVAPN